MLISQLIIAPVLILETWFYHQYVKRRDGVGFCAFDYVVIAVAVLSCAALLPLVAAHESGVNDRIWHPVLSVLTTFHTFPMVLFVGVWLRKRFVSG
jgi:hypothetical protein